MLCNEVFVPSQTPRPKSEHSWTCDTYLGKSKAHTQNGPSYAVIVDDAGSSRSAASPRTSGRAGGDGRRAGGGRSRRRAPQPFSAPRTNAPTMKRCRTTKSTIAGSTAITLPAARMPVEFVA